MPVTQQEYCHCSDEHIPANVVIHYEESAQFRVVASVQCNTLNTNATRKTTHNVENNETVLSITKVKVKEQPQQQLTEDAKKCSRDDGGMFR